MVAHYPIRRIFPHGAPGRRRQRLHAVRIHGRYHVVERVIQGRVVVRIVPDKTDGRLGRSRQTLIQTNVDHAPRIVGSRARPNHLAQRILFVGQIHQIAHLGHGKRVHVVKGIVRSHAHAGDQPVLMGHADDALLKQQRIIVRPLRVETERDQHGRTAHLRHIASPRPPLHVAVQIR